MARKRLAGPSGLESSPPELKPLFSQAYLDEINEWFRKWMAAKAKHPPSGSEKPRRERDDANHIEKGQKGMSRARFHSLSELVTPQTHPLSPTPTRLTCLDMYRHVETPPGPPQSMSDANRAVQQGHRQPPLPPSPLHPSSSRTP